jgi:hypothetical protein
MMGCLSSLAALARAAVLISLAISLRFEAQTGATQVNLSPGENIQSFVSNNPPGTTFVLSSGVYRMQSIVPKDNDVFIGQGQVDLNGSQVLTFQKNENLWSASAQASSLQHGSCLTSYPLCGYTQDLFFDNRLLTPVSDRNSLNAGNWYFDRANDMVYLSANPSGHTVELSMQQYALSGHAAGVQIQSIVVEKYGTPAQSGAVGGDSKGSGWVVTSIEVRWNHGRGVSLGAGSQVLHSFIHHNGQLGLTLYGANSRAQNNEISWNNYAGFDPGWEGGGTKFSKTSGLLVQSNYVHDNNGRGLWTDIDNVDTIYDGNTVTNNAAEGIAHEISYKAIIRNNICKGNGNNATQWLWNAQIIIQNSENVEVYGNTVEVASGGGNGIAIVNQKRGAGGIGPYVSMGNSIHNNTIVMLGHSGESGFADDTHQGQANNNTFDYNHYIIKGGGSAHWSWMGYLDWNGFRQKGQETHGTCCN